MFTKPTRNSVDDNLDGLERSVVSICSLPRSGVDERELTFHTSDVVLLWLWSLEGPDSLSGSADSLTFGVVI